MKFFSALKNFRWLGVRVSHLEFRQIDRPLLRLALALAILLPASSAFAFPPAPSHIVYGVVRDEYGLPLSVSDAQILIEPTNGVQIVGTIVPNLEPGVNYRLRLSMDSGIAPDEYKVTALRPFVAFRIRVKIGAVTYLPMEMAGNFVNLGQPAQTTRIDLTLGVDANNDGLPDAWQQLLRSMLGSNAKISPTEDADTDGISNLHEYLAGTYAFLPDSGFRLNLVPNADGPPLLEFMVVSPHTYTVYNSTDLHTWTPIPFSIPAGGSTATNLPNYHATEIRVLQVAPILPPDVPHPGQFFKVQVQ
jgi:hypothetical protein